MIEPGAANVKNTRRVFAELPNPSGGSLVCREMKMRHLRDSVTHGLVSGAFGGVAASNVRDRNVVNHACLRSGKNLEAVTENHDNIRLQLFKGIGQADYAEPNRLRSGGRR